MFRNWLRMVTDNICNTKQENEKQEKEPAKVEEQTTSQPTKVPVKFQTDINTLIERYGELNPGKRIVISLHDALAYFPRDRKRVDAYASLAKWLKENRGVELIIESNKTKNNNGSESKTDK